MKVLASKEDSLKIWLSLFLLGGSVIGTLFCNKMTGEMKEELMILGQSSLTRTVLAEMDRSDLLLRVLPKRIWVLLLMVLASTTPMADWCMRLAAGYIGFSNSVLISVLTMESGVRGVLRYLLFVFPQCICYVAAGYFILWWMPVKKKRLTLLSFLFLFDLVCAGAFAESFLNPWFMVWF